MEVERDDQIGDDGVRQNLRAGEQWAHFRWEVPRLLFYGPYLGDGHEGAYGVGEGDLQN